ncbi:hypothetical protein BHE90_008310 [Fusarium euwallaceae]|uniref:Uncharacterized protein n=2 Tax=Fusarium solani species complex TaxID=232080 RepID=A0A430LNA5_9HYPO|nr:hypothetical protein CEP51_008481 [Fusarium floridanum]RTE77204.1 hypothetical protein BHE90_008310 [Fusarium euwallaceae]
MGEDVESPEPRIQSPVARHQSLGFKDWQVSERESSLPLAREGRTSAGEEAGQPSPIGDQDETSDGREDKASLTPTLVDPPLQTSNVAPLRCTPTVACQWGLIVASFNRSISDRLGDVQMTEMMLQRAVITHQYPVGPMPEAKLNLYIVSAQMKVAVSCGQLSSPILAASLLLTSALKTAT